jgi:hypothetical protein
LQNSNEYDLVCAVPLLKPAILLLLLCCPACATQTDATPSAPGTLADYQARIAALQIAGRLSRPDDIKARIEREMAHAHWRFEERPRHQGEVDYYDFRRSLKAELRLARHA